MLAADRLGSCIPRNADLRKHPTACIGDLNPCLEFLVLYDSTAFCIIIYYLNVYTCDNKFELLTLIFSTYFFLSVRLFVSKKLISSKISFVQSF